MTPHDNHNHGESGSKISKNRHNDQHGDDHPEHHHDGHHQGHHHGHHGHHHGPADFGTAFAIGAALNAGFVGAEVVFGLAANSVALLADAAHNLGDVLALLLSWGAASLGRRLPSQRRTYGWGRSTILAALLNAAVLLVGVGAIGVAALQRFGDPQPVAGMTVMIVAACGILVNGFTAWLFARGQADLNIRAAFLHMLADAAVSAGVVLAALAIMRTGWHWIDPAVSLVIATVIAVSTWGVLRDAVNLSVDGVPAGIAHADVQAVLRDLPGVSEVHDLHIWGLSTTETALTAHLVRNSDSDTTQARPSDDQALILRANAELQERFGIGHVTLQVESQALAIACRLRPDHVV